MRFSQFMSDREDHPTIKGTSKLQKTGFKEGKPSLPLNLNKTGSLKSRGQAKFCHKEHGASVECWLSFRMQ